MQAIVCKKKNKSTVLQHFFPALNITTNISRSTRNVTTTTAFCTPQKKTEFDLLAVTATVGWLLDFSLTITKGSLNGWLAG